MKLQAGMNDARGQHDDREIEQREKEQEFCFLRAGLRGGRRDGQIIPPLMEIICPVM
jgi:hypothetical protein